MTVVLNGDRSRPESEAICAEVYAQLRALVGEQLRHERGGLRGVGSTMQLTQVVHECWIKLQSTSQWDNRAHFFGAAVRATRQIFVDAARKRRVRGITQPLVNAPSDDSTSVDTIDHRVLEVDAAIRLLHDIDARAAHVAELKLFADLSSGLIAEIVGITERTVQRDWQFARAWIVTRFDDEEIGLLGK